MSIQQGKLGLIAGYGNMPIQILNAATAMGQEMVCVALKGMAFEGYEDYCPNVAYVGLGEVEKTMMFFKDHGVTSILLAGKVDKTALFRDGEVQFDQSAQKLMGSLNEGNDDAILLGIVKLFEASGLKVMDSTSFLKSTMPEKGVLTPWELSDEIQSELQFGFKMAKAIGGLDIGQTVVVKSGAVVAVEAIEGTDQAILRGGELAQGGAVVVKVAKPSQDLRFDVPAIGADTIKNCKKARVKALGFEAGATILLQKDDLVKLATEYEIHLVSMEPV